MGVGSRMLALARRTRYWSSVFPLVDAINLVVNEEKPGEARIYLSPIKREVVVRRMTTDLLCLEKVFIGNEYQSPFDIMPQVIVDAGANIGMATLFFAHAY